MLREHGPAGAVGMEVKAEMGLPSPATNTVTPRRSTRVKVTTSTTTATVTQTTKLDLSSYAYKASPPRKRFKQDASLQTPPKVKAEPAEPLTPITSRSFDDPGIGSSTTPLKDEKAGSSTPRSAKKSMPLEKLAKAHPAPAKWEEQYRLIEHMRKGIIAPVDDMGCERPRTTADADPKTIRFHILISLMLSSQTKDAVTSQAVTNLHTTLPGGLTAESLAVAPVEMVYECINKVGFWRRKTEYIQDAARKLLERPGEEKGDVPDTIEGLCELKGVGPKMAFLALQCAWDINAGIGVDVHVHRITNRLKWHKPPTQTPEQTRINLESWLPPHLHKPINPMLVGFGQIICLPVGPRCDVCLLGKQKICPSRVANVKSEGRKEVVYSFTDSLSVENSGSKTEVKAKVEIEYD